MIAVEMGFSTVKVMTGSESFNFPSALVELTGSMSFGTASSGVYEYEGRKLLVGDHALVRADQDYKLELEWLIETAPIFVFHALTLARRGNEDTVVVGLPPEYFFDNMNQLRQRLYSYVVNGKHYGFKRVYVVPQGVGSFYDYCNLNPPSEDDVSLLVDIGANTVNAMLAFGEMVVPEESTQFTRCGACIPAKEVIAVLRRRDTTISQPQAHQILKSGKFAGEDFVGLPEILRKFAQQTLDRIYNQYANHNLKRVIFSGGGAALIKEYLPSSHKFSNKFCFIDDPVYSNVRGYYLVGLSQIVEHNL